MERIAVMTSGGDAPGMNAAIYAVYRVAAQAGVQVFGVRNGYRGLIQGDIRPLRDEEVEDIFEEGGTILGTVRSDKFKNESSARSLAVRNLAEAGMEGLIVIGGDGSQKGALAVHLLGFPVVGVASTVDNDLWGSEITIGVDTALNVIIDSINRIRTTAESHHRAFLIEVMGRNHGYLALMAGIAGEAEVIVTPEEDMQPEDVAQALKEADRRGRRYAIVVVTEGASCNAERINSYFKEHERSLGYELRTTILGHIQRGGQPSYFDRMLAIRLGSAAVWHLLGGIRGELVGWRKGEVSLTPLDEVAAGEKGLKPDTWRLAEVLTGT